MDCKITPEDWVLAFVRLGPKQDADKSTIKGWLMFTKQFFVFIKEVEKDLAPYFDFIPYDYGPYSFVLDETIKKLENDGFIFTIKHGDRTDFILSSDGCKRADRIIANISDKKKRVISHLRRDATQLGYSGILRYVYSRYPEYTTASKIKGWVMGES